MCAPCGVLRRNLLNEGAQGYDLIATGHNLDDEAQSVMMNIIKANHWLVQRTGPRTGPEDRKGFVPRIKPLFFCKEREVAIYAHLKGLRPAFEECPHAAKSFRAVVRNWLNTREQEKAGFKRDIVESAMRWGGMLSTHRGETRLRTCVGCGQPSRGESCAACEIIALHAYI